MLENLTGENMVDLVRIQGFRQFFKRDAICSMRYINVYTFLLQSKKADVLMSLCK